MLLVKMTLVLIFVFFLSCKKYCWGERNDIYEVGCDTFDVVVKSAAFVDKTLLIKEFFNYRRILITAPRRFGKSVNMDMIKKFSEVVVDENGNMVPKKETENYRLFTDEYNKAGGIKEVLDIYRVTNESFFEEHFGQYPVIYIDFKSLSGTSYSQFLDDFRKIIGRLFGSYAYLLESNKLDMFQIRYLNRFFDQIIHNNLTEADLKDCTLFLTKILHRIFNKRVIVLIDECDAPIQEAIFESGKEIHKIVHFLKKFISNLVKSNDYVERALVNACLRLSGVITNDANNIVRFLFNENHPFKPYYGLTENEVKRLTKKLNISKNISKIRARYDGYNVPNSNLKLYNVFSVVNYLEFREFKNYWVRSDSIKNIKKILLNENIRVKIHNLLNDETVDINIADKITVDEIHMLRKLVGKEKCDMLAVEEIFVFLHFMLDLGYFTATKIRGNRVTIKIPNKEIKDEISNDMYCMEYYKEKFHLTDKEVREYVNSIHGLGESITSYQEFGKCVLNLFTHVDMPEEEAELQEVMAAIPRFYREFKEVKSQATKKVKHTPRRVSRKSNKTMTVPVYDFIDILIIRGKDNTGIIFDLKYFNSGVSEINFSPYTGLEQIINNKYYKVFDSGKYKVRNKIYVGVTVKKSDKITRKPQCIVSSLYNSTDLKDNKTCTVDK